MVGGNFQKAGLFLVLHEVTLGISVIGGFVPIMLDLNQDRAQSIHENAVTLLRMLDKLEILETTTGIHKAFRNFGKASTIENKDN